NAACVRDFAVAAASTCRHLTYGFQTQCASASCINKRGTSSRVQKKPHGLGIVDTCEQIDRIGYSIKFDLCGVCALLETEIPNGRFRLFKSLCVDRRVQARIF